MAIEERAFRDAMQQLGITRASGKTLLRTLMNILLNILLEEHDKMLSSFKSQLYENGEAGSLPSHRERYDRAREEGPLFTLVSFTFSRLDNWVDVSRLALPSH